MNQKEILKAIREEIRRIDKKSLIPECGCEFTFMGEDMILKYSDNISEMLRFVMCPCCHEEVRSWKE